jgi:hypothetical protein
MSLYGEYLKERENKEIIESETGYATYYFVDKDNAVYLENIFVTKEHRRNGETFVLAGKIIEIAKARGCNKMYGTVCPGTPGASMSLTQLLNHGFVLDSSANNLVVVRKDF